MHQRAADLGATEQAEFWARHRDGVETTSRRRPERRTETAVRCNVGIQDGWIGRYDHGTRLCPNKRATSPPPQARCSPRTARGHLTRPDHVLADKAHTSRKNRRYLRRRGIRHTIPERLDQRRHRRNRGSRGGRPTGFDRERYKKRNTVERAVNRLKDFRAVSTRYEKRAYIYLGTVTLAALIIWLRT